MQIQTIEANVMDLAGGELIRRETTSHVITLHVLNVIDTMMQELTYLSPKAIRGYRTTQTLAADVFTGTWTLNNVQFEPGFLRYRETDTEPWQLLPIAMDVETLTRAETDHRNMIMFTNVTPPDFGYHLSFKPTKAISVEVWSKQKFTEVTDLRALPPFPEEASLLCAYRAAMFALNELLLIDAKQFTSFVIAQKLTIQGELFRLQHIWDVYRTTPADKTSIKRTRPYDSAQDFLDRESVDGGAAFIPPVTS